MGEFLWDVYVPGPEERAYLMCGYHPACLRAAAPARQRMAHKAFAAASCVRDMPRAAATECVCGVSAVRVCVFVCVCVCVCVCLPACLPARLRACVDRVVQWGPG